MAINKEPNGRRSVQVEVEVPGTPEQVWEAIATGPGVSSWFVPMTVENGSDGKPSKMILNFGPGMDCPATFTSWDPPHRFTAENAIAGPNTPTCATEWIVEARSGDKCVVRVVHSLFTATDDWDGQLEGVESGWPGFFRILRLYLTHFRGQRSSLIQIMSGPAESLDKAWHTLTDPLGLATVKEGQQWKAPPGAPPLAGVIDSFGSKGSHRDVLIKLNEPTTGTACLGAFMCGPAMTQVSLYLYGDKAADVAKRDEPLWQKWLTERFPAPK
jgi:uncharacterized protein YndB with AHSA1/START domain